MRKLDEDQPCRLRRIVEDGAIRFLVTLEFRPAQIKVDALAFSAEALGRRPQGVFGKLQPVVADDDLNLLGGRRMARLENPLAIPFDADVEGAEKDEKNSGDESGPEHE